VLRCEVIKKLQIVLLGGKKRSYRGFSTVSLIRTRIPGVSIGASIAAFYANLQDPSPRSLDEGGIFGQVRFRAKFLNSCVALRAIKQYELSRVTT
jgi:hypothetical protein